MNEAMKLLMYQIIILNIMSFLFGALFGIEIEKFKQRLEKKDLDKDC